MNKGLTALYLQRLQRFPIKSSEKIKIVLENFVMFVSVGAAPCGCPKKISFHCRQEENRRTNPGDHAGSPLRRRNKLRSVPIFGMKISHTLRCSSFSAKSHVCECYVFVNAHITPSRHYQLFTVFMESEQA